MKLTNRTSVSDAIFILEDVDFLCKMDAIFTSVELPEITYGQRIDLSEIKTWKDLLFVPQKILRGLNDNSIMNMPFFEAYNYGMSVIDELSRMNKRDENSLKYNPTKEELKAGYNDLNHGIFGVVDKIAVRLHISHDEVFNLPEKRVFAILKIDFDNMMYQKRYNEIISKTK